VKPWVDGKRDVLRQWGALRAQRRAIQNARRVGDRVLLQALPLTHAPMVRRGVVARVAERTLDLGLRGWWRLVRRWVR